MKVEEVRGLKQSTLIVLMLQPLEAARRVAQLKESCCKLNLTIHLPQLWPILIEKVRLPLD